MRRRLFFLGYQRRLGLQEAAQDLAPHHLICLLNWAVPFRAGEATDDRIGAHILLYFRNSNIVHHVQRPCRPCI